jgi:hypothetical protein
MLQLTLIISFLAIIYEFVYINEDFLFIISFSIFFYNVINAVSGLLYVELSNRRQFLNELNKFNLNLKKQTLNLNLQFFNFLVKQDLESNILFILNSLTNSVKLVTSVQLINKVDLNAFNFLNVFEIENTLAETYSLEQFN